MVQAFLQSMCLERLTACQSIQSQPSKFIGKREEFSCLPSNRNEEKVLTRWRSNLEIQTPNKIRHA
jgi:hypothetical protein